ncbi:hypothetical protein [Bacillus massilinigeriensis]|nr:hypothetical protein [Bacillus mediterraneensis]
MATGAGVLASTLITYAFEGIKVGKNETNFTDGIKGGVQKGIKTVAGWFK